MYQHITPAAIEIILQLMLLKCASSHIILQSNFYQQTLSTLNTAGQVEEMIGDQAFSREPVEFPSDHPLGSALEKLQEQLLCPICQDLFFNPELLLCGHSFCSLCIRRHCDPMINRSTSNVCPICRAKADTFDLRKNVSLAIAVEHFGGLRNGLVNVLNSSAASAISTSSNNKYTSSSDSLRAEAKSGKAITMRLTQFNLHGLSKDKVKKIIDQATKDARVKLRIDGDKDALEKRLKDFVHLHNSQLGAMNALTLDQVIERVNAQSLAMEKEQAKANHTLGSVEKLKNGQETTEISFNFKKLAQAAKQNKKKQLQALKKASASSAFDDIATEEEANCDNADNRDVITTVNEIVTSEKVMDDWTWLEKVPQTTKQDWQIVFSQKLQRPFFYHAVTKTGQFRVPSPFETFRYQDVVSSSSDEFVVEFVEQTTQNTLPVGSPPHISRNSSHSNKRKRNSEDAMQLEIDPAQSQSQSATAVEAIRSSRRSFRARHNPPENESCNQNSQPATASSQKEAATAAIETVVFVDSADDDSLRLTLENEERLFLTAQSQESSALLFTQSQQLQQLQQQLTDGDQEVPLQPQPPKVNVTRTKTIVVGGSVSSAGKSATAFSSKFQSPSKTLVETIDMTGTLYEEQDGRNNESRSTIRPASAEKTQIDVELRSSVTQQDDGHTGNDSAMMMAVDEDSEPSFIESTQATMTPSYSQHKPVASSQSLDNKTNINNSDMDDGPWSCGLCTFLNPVPRAKCAVCDHTNLNYMNIASRAKRTLTPLQSSSTTPNSAGVALSFSFDKDALRRMQQKQQQQPSSKKRK